MQQVKLDQNISVKDVDVLAFDYLVAEKTPNELQVINAQERKQGFRNYNDLCKMQGLMSYRNYLHWI
ncbi:hypothetical protein [Ornithobacterium rhinotracheale]|uniref:hypothetical protein n=1 Tax=Ornithobacterium rhinotracheale TaxID=28251 RepID=UPI001FF35407|nr:hypothetical protein [Ornithobacterium rhinotracheale]MCK0194568.1 hypothetical protein [Ornithobacterium rhinotracheale]